PYQLELPDDWVEEEADPIEPRADFAVEYHAQNDSRTTLHITWIRKPKADLPERVERVLDWSRRYGWFYSAALVDPAASSVDAELAYARGASPRQLRLVGSADGSNVWLAAASRTGPDDQLAACEAILARLELRGSSKRKWWWYALLFGGAFGFLALATSARRA